MFSKAHMTVAVIIILAIVLTRILLFTSATQKTAVAIWT
jgi:hypothetical protein